MRKVRQIFNPVLPDELVISVGERVTGAFLFISLFLFAVIMKLIVMQSFISFAILCDSVQLSTHSMTVGALLAEMDLAVSSRWALSPHGVSSNLLLVFAQTVPSEHPV